MTPSGIEPATCRCSAPNTKVRYTKLKGQLGVMNSLTLNLLTTTIVAHPSNASKWQMGFNSAFKRLKEVRSLYGAFSTLRPFGLLYSYPQSVPAFISRGATHHTDARDLYQRRRELLPMSFACKSVIHENPLGSFTCSKAGTWDRFFYFPSEGRHTEDFLDARKIQRLRLGLNPRTRVPVASMLTTRPPKPS